MQVVKRNGDTEQVKLEKISKRISRVSKDLKNVDPIAVAQKIIQGLFDGVTTVELDKLAVETAYSLTTKHPEYDTLATRLVISALHKDTPGTFTEVIEKLNHTYDVWGNKRSVISKELYSFVKKHGHVLDAAIDYTRDYTFDYFGFKTLERSYLLKTNEIVDGRVISKIIERPQHLWMRVAVGIHLDDIDAVLETYHLMSTKQATHATPTLFNAGLTKNQLSSCFLLGISGNGDSIVDIYDTLKECALISQSAGGLGVHIHNVRSKGSPIYGTGGTSNGLVPMLKVFNETARYVDQCLSGEVEIATASGLKPIEELTTEDQVKNFQGSTSQITNTKQFNYSGEMIVVNINGVKSTVTPHHPILVLRNADQFSHEDITQRVKSGLLVPEWVEAENLLMTDICVGLSD